MSADSVVRGQQGINFFLLEEALLWTIDGYFVQK